MKIFISWSGKRSEALATALHKWLPVVLQFTSPWLSQSDIPSGKLWSVEVSQELENCNFGIICVTRENIESPWILFEAGALAKSMKDGCVVPLLLDLDFKEISGPLAQFQAKKVDRDGIKDLVRDLNKAHTSPIIDSTFEALFKGLYADLEKDILEIPKINTPAKIKRQEGEILEELVSSVRGVENRVREFTEMRIGQSTDDELIMRRRNRARVHPMVMHKLMHTVMEGRRDPIQYLFFASQFRDEVPWLYELGLAAYREAISDNQGGKSNAVRQFNRVFDFVMRGPFTEELGLDRRELMIFREEFMDPISRGETEPKYKMDHEYKMSQYKVPTDKKVKS